MADITPEEAAQLGLPLDAASVEARRKAMNEDPLAVAWALLTGQDSPTSGGYGKFASAQGIGFNPTRTGNEANALAQSFQTPAQVANSAAMDARFRAGAQAAPGASPYSNLIADQSRPAQLALLQQMQAQQAGPSLAAMQGARAQGANLQAALGAGGGRSVMSQAGQVGSGLSASAAQARLAEMLRGSIGLGNAATGVRGADLGVAGNAAQFGLQQRGLDDAMRQFYASQGARLSDANAGLQSERDKVYALTKLKNDARDLDNGKKFAQSAASIFAGAM